MTAANQETILELRDVKILSDPLRPFSKESR